MLNILHITLVTDIMFWLTFANALYVHYGTQNRTSLQFGYKIVGATVYGKAVFWPALIVEKNIIYMYLYIHLSE